MIKIDQLKEILETDAKEFKNMDSEKLRLMLGVHRYIIRLLERELNSRFDDNPLGNID